MSLSRSDIEQLFAQPFNDLIFQAQTAHRQHFDPNAVQVSTLLSIKTGGCSEDCGYCSQSARHDTGLDREGLMAVDDVIDAAKAAKAKQERTVAPARPGNRPRCPFDPRAGRCAAPS